MEEEHPRSRIDSQGSGEYELWRELEKTCRVEGRLAFNLKAMYGNPSLFARVVRRMAAEIPPGAGILGADEGVAPLLGALALNTGSPVWCIRNRVHHNRISLGVEDQWNRPWISGGKPDPDQYIVVVDDIMGSGSKVLRAISLSREAGLNVKSALVIFAYGNEQEGALLALGEVNCALGVFHLVGTCAS